MPLSVTYLLQNTMTEPLNYRSEAEKEIWRAFKRVYEGAFANGYGSYTAQQLANAKLDDGYSALHAAAALGNLDEFDDVYPDIMLDSKYGQSRDSQFYDESAMALAIKSRRLNQVWAGVTSRLLAAAPTRDGASLLYLAAQYGCIEQIYGGVTAQELADQVGDNHCSALFWVISNRQIQLVKDFSLRVLFNDRVVKKSWTPDKGCRSIDEFFEKRCLALMPPITVDDLKTVLYPDSGTLLSRAARFECLDQVSGGVTATQLKNVNDSYGQSALFNTAAAGSLKQLKEMPTLHQLADCIAKDGIYSDNALYWVQSSQEWIALLGGTPHDYWRKLSPKEQTSLRILLKKADPYYLTSELHKVFFSGERNNPLWLPDGLLQQLPPDALKPPHTTLSAWFKTQTEANLVSNLLEGRLASDVFDSPEIRCWMNRCLVKYPEVITIAMQFGFQFKSMSDYIFRDMCGFKAVFSDGHYQLEPVDCDVEFPETPLDKHAAQDELNDKVANFGHSPQLIEKLVLLERPLLKAGTEIFPAICVKPFLNELARPDLPRKAKLLDMGDVVLLINESRTDNNGIGKWLIYAPRMLNTTDYRHCWDCDEADFPGYASKAVRSDFKFI